jgi:hypothetical protein
MARRSIFISYAHEDRPQVEPSAELLRAGGVQVFIDVRGIDYGDRWQDVLRGALEKCERVMVFWSLAAQASEWVDREWRYALSLGKRIVPPLLDRTPLPDELKQFQALPRYRDAVALAPAPAERAPAVRWTALAAAVALLVGGAWVWTSIDAPIHASRPHAPVSMPASSAAATPAPAPALPATGSAASTPPAPAPSSDLSPAWWLAVLGAVLAAILGLRRAYRRRSRAAEAARFVDQVFAD